MKKFTLVSLAMMASASCFAQTTLWNGEDKNWVSGNLVGISINLCKSIQKELFINDTP